MNRNTGSPRMYGDGDGSHVSSREKIVGGELERVILAIYAVENMVPLFNKLVEHGYLTGAEHAEFIQRYKLLATRLSPRALAIENRI